MKLVLTEEIQERELCAQGEVLVRCRCMLPKLQPLPPRAQRRLERCLTELDRRWNRACEGWLLEQAAEGAQLARRNALPFAPLEAVLGFETTLLDERFWSVRWQWPALAPPWKRATMSECSASISVIFPLPSSPQLAPTIAFTMMQDSLLFRIGNVRFNGSHREPHDIIRKAEWKCKVKINKIAVSP